MSNVSYHIQSYLLDHPNTWLSGQTIANACQTTRNTVWRIVNQMNQAGYHIESITGCGYYLHTSADPIDAKRLKAELTVSRITVLDQCDSTHTVLKEQIKTGADHLTLVIADRQSAGQGRQGRAFFSPPHTGLYMSLLIKPEQLKRSIPTTHIPPIVALATAKGIDDVLMKSTLNLNDQKKCTQTSLPTCQIKWVNDLIWNGKKVGGILTQGEIDFESLSVKELMVGIGLNVYAPKQGFPKPIQSSAIALLPNDQMVVGLRHALIRSILNHLMELLEETPLKDIHQAYVKRCTTIGQTIQLHVHHTCYEGLVTDISPEFELILTLPNGEIKSFSYGEATTYPQIYQD